MAATLNNLSNRLAEAGRCDEGLAAAGEAVSMYRLLAAADPARFGRAVAASLNNLSNRLAERDGTARRRPLSTRRWP